MQSSLYEWHVQASVLTVSAFSLDVNIFTFKIVYPTLNNACINAFSKYKQYER